MALYRFEIKKSKGTAGKEHADYLNREGAYKNIDLKEAIKQQTFSQENTLSSVENKSSKKSLLRERSLYENACGSIKEEDNKLKISDGASEDTVWLAVVLAKKKYGDTLNISGSLEFKAKVVKAVADMDYEIVFTEPQVKIQTRKLKERYADERNEFERQNRRTSTIGAGISFNDFKRIGESEEVLSSERKDSLQILSIRNMDGDNELFGMLLHGNKTDDMVNKTKVSNYSVRRNVHSAKKRHIEKLANEILVEKKFSIGSSHADYINRDDVFAVKGGCIYKGHRLPMWANDSPRNFFAAADKYERKNGTPYIEYVLSLQNELTLEQNLEIVNTFLNHCELMKDKYYAFAIHNKEAALDKTQQQIHCHLMFSTRCIDDIEKKSERAPDVFFSRYIPQNPEKGGCKKDRRFNFYNKRNRANSLISARKLWAKITNAVLEKYGVDVKLSYKSLEAQREDALKERDFVRAEILNRAPEKYLGPSICQDQNAPEVMKIKKTREENKKRIELIKAKDLAQEILKERELNLKTSAHQRTIRNVKYYADRFSNKITDPDFIRLKDLLIDLNNKFVEKSPQVISFKTALEQSRLSFMSSDEVTAYNELKNINIKTTDLKKELTSASETKQKEINDLLGQYKNISNGLKQTLAEANKRLLEPKLKSKITKTANAILKENQPIRDEVNSIINQTDEINSKLRKFIVAELSKNQPQLKEENASGNLSVASIKKEDTINTSEVIQPAKKGTASEDNISKENIETQQQSNETAVQTYTAIEIRNILSDMERELQRTIKMRENDLSFLYKKIINEERARTIALDVVTNKKFKMLRGKNAELNKNKEELDKVKQDIKEITFNITGMPKTDEQYPKLKQAYIKNTDKQTVLTKSIIDLEKQVDNLTKEINAIISRPQIKTKINQVVQGILTKNAPIKNNYNEMFKNLSNMKTELNKISKLKDNVIQQIKIDKGKNVSYTVKGASDASSASVSNNKQKDASVIATVMSGDLAVGINVIRIDDNKYDEFADYVSQNLADKQAKENELARNL